MLDHNILKISSAVILNHEGKTTVQILTYKMSSSVVVKIASVEIQTSKDKSKVK